MNARKFVDLPFSAAAEECEVFVFLFYSERKTEKCLHQ